MVSKSAGRVVRIRDDRGFGFIQGDDGQEYFFHVSSVVGDPATIAPGRAVIFDAETSPRGLRAGAVEPVD
jgi:cold shock CspA family protein